MANLEAGGGHVTAPVLQIRRGLRMDRFRLPAIRHHHRLGAVAGHPAARLGRVDLIDNGDAVNPYELVETDPRTGKSKTIWRNQKVIIHDFWVSADGAIYVAGVTPTGLPRSVIPASVRIFRSVDRANWEETA